MQFQFIENVALRGGGGIELRDIFFFIIRNVRSPFRLIFFSFFFFFYLFYRHSDRAGKNVWELNYIRCARDPDVCYDGRSWPIIRCDKKLTDNTRWNSRRARKTRRPISIPSK